MQETSEPSVETYTFPLSAQQRRLWFVQQLDSESAAYNLPLALDLRGPLDPQCLSRALDEIVRRHEVLRTTYPARDGEPSQEVHPPRPLPLPLVDLSDLAEAEAADRARAMRRAACERPFDLGAGPLLRAELLRFGPDRHELQLVMHHIVTDGWSEGVLVRELEALYRAYRRGQPSPLPEPKIQYADYALWQRGRADAGTLDASLAYWRRQLAGLRPLELPRERTAARAAGRGAMLPFDLSPELARALRELARQEEVTLFVVLLAAFQVLLGRYAGQTDVAVGTLIANRNQKETEDLIGFFVNTLVLRSDLSGPLTFRQLLERVQKVTLDAFEHQDVPFDRLVEELNPERRMGETPLVQAGLVLQNMPSPDLDLDELQVETVSTEYGYSFVDVGASLREGPNGISGSLMYSTDLFQRPAMERLIAHFVRVLEAAAAHPDRQIDDLSLLTAEEHERWIVGWNDTRDAGERPFVTDLFEASARTTPDATAVVYEGERLGYGELNRRANRLARRLMREGAGPESRVAICLDRDPAMIVAVLGVLKSGAAYVPLDPAHPDERNAFVLADARVALVVTNESHAARFQGSAVKVVLVGGHAAEEAEEAADPVRRNGRQDLAYIIYTSGSTGTPKGVLVVHEGLANVIHASIAILEVGPESRVSQLASLTFDASVAEILTPLCAGATLCIISHRRLLSGADFVQALQDEAITVLGCVPSILALLSPDDLPALRTVVVGGEACPPEVAARWLGRRRLLNAYAPTEATIYSSLSECQPDRTSLTIGRPIANARTYILDDALNPLPLGVVGEICIGGVGVARGYWGRPELTAEHFVPDPFADGSGCRLYRTGDLGVLREPGQIEFRGRRDDQVKLRGHRIELGEIESALREHAGDGGWVVAVREDDAGERRLVAYFVAERMVTSALPGLRERLRTTLPEYMVPAAFVSVEAMPLTPNGKVDRRALPTPHFGGSQAYAAPRTVTEEILAGVWAEVLGLERVGTQDDFFESGGHSLLATQVVARARNAGLEVPLAALFEERTIARLAARLAAAEPANAAAALPPLGRRATTGDAPLSFAQQRLWFLEQADPGHNTYNLPLVLRLRGALRSDVLGAALDTIVQRHPALRTSFPARDGGPYQHVAASGTAGMRVVRLDDVGEEGREERARAVVEEEIRQPFDLSRGPLLRALLLALDDRDHVLCLTVHHIVCDALSLAVFVRELGACYDALRAGEPAALDPLPIEPADVAVWERDWLRGEALDAHLEYWRRTLAGSPAALDLPTDFPRPAVRSFECEQRSVVLSAETWQRVRRLGRGVAATDFMTMLALVDAWLFQLTGQPDILVGTPVSNRRHLETEGLVGFFVNTVVFRSVVDGRATFADLLQQVRTRAVESYAYQALPFEKLVDELGVERLPGRNPLFQVLVNVATEPEGELVLGGLEAQDWDTGLARSGFDLHVGARVGSAGVEVVCTYSTELFRAASVESMLEAFADLARLVGESEATPLAQVNARLAELAQERRLEEKRQRSERQRPGVRAARRQVTVAAAGEGDGS